MPGSKSDSHETVVLNLLRATDITAPTTVYLALFTTDPTDTGTAGTEVSGGAYARQPITFGAPTGTSPTQVANSATITFPTATADWGTISHLAIMNDLSGTAASNYMYVGAWDTPKIISTDDTAEIPTDNLVVTED